MIARKATVREIIFIIQLPFVFINSPPNDAYPSAAGGLAIFYSNAWPKERIPLNVHIAKPELSAKKKFLRFAFGPRPGAPVLREVSVSKHIRRSTDTPK